jgi:hypothetical protein
MSRCRPYHATIVAGIFCAGGLAYLDRSEVWLHMLPDRPIFWQF